MVHACAACTLRFPTTGELRDHVESAHVERRPVEPSAPPVRRHRTLTADAYSRSGWVVPEDAPTPAG